jgi:hypothetical protein
VLNEDKPVRKYDIHASYRCKRSFKRLKFSWLKLIMKSDFEKRILK